MPASPGLTLKIPPLLLTLVCGLLMAWLAYGWRPEGGGPVEDSIRSTVAAALALLGAMVCIAGVLAFRRARTTVDPRKPANASSLVVSGIYRLTRNPMYLGFLLLLAAWALFLGSPATILVLPFFVMYLNRFQIRPEEAALRAHFGPAFDDYTARVRRWI